jgi:hypothetical protein
MPGMDENRPVYPLKRSGEYFPRVDDHLVEPEVTRDEIIGGQRVVALPAEPPQARLHSRLNYVLCAHVVPGYSGATFLLTRFDEESDFASSSCVHKNGIDPQTGARHLEEIAFMVVSEQNERYLAEKTRRMHCRGVRRIFSLWVEDSRVCEWSPEGQGWRPLDRDSCIEDPCLVAPLAVAALFDRRAADNAVAEALIAKGKVKGRIKGTAEAISKILDARGFSVSPAQREEILCCQDAGQLNRWLRRAAVASSADEVLSED